MRRDAKVDANQIEMRLAFRKMGASVLSLATIGKGCPDLVLQVLAARDVADENSGEHRADHVSICDACAFKQTAEVTA